MRSCVALFLTVAMAWCGVGGFGSPALGHELPVEFHGLWELDGKVGLAPGLDKMRYYPASPVQVYIDGDQIFFWGGGLAAPREVQYEASEEVNGAHAMWLVDLLGSCPDCTDLTRTGAWPGPTWMVLVTEPFDVDGVTVCPDPPCIELQDLVGGLEGWFVYTQQASTPATTVPFSQLKARY